LALKGPVAAEALEYAALSRTHHVRSASLRALARVNEERAKTLATHLLNDKAFEVRDTAMKILGITPPKEVKRGYRLRRTAAPKNNPEST
jgi:HEAT repeat protein